MAAAAVSAASSLGLEPWASHTRIKGEKDMASAAELHPKTEPPVPLVCLC